MNSYKNETTRGIAAMIHGISHITLMVKDLERTAKFLEAVFGAVRVYESGERQYSIAKEMFFQVGGVWLCIMEGEPLSERTYNHIAFQIAEEDFEEYRRKVEVSGVDWHPARSRVAGECRSLYFYDFDNHLFELHTGTLEERLMRYRKGE